MSRQSRLRRAAENTRLFGRVTRRFIAGTRLEDAIAVCRRLRSESILATLDHLGENVTTAEQAVASAADAIEAVDRIEREGLPATISIKLTQFGLDLSDSLCRDRVTALVARARAADTRVEVDMESSAYTDRTLDLVQDLHAQYGNVRSVIQAYLYRSEADVTNLNRKGIPVRLCKGAYLEPPDVAYPAKEDVDGNYRRLMERLLREGKDPALATHDESIINEAISLVGRLGIAPDRFEFQMLYGIRRDLQRKLVRQGYRVRLYVPYGSAWYPYFMRRLAERPANILFLLRNLIKN